MFCKLVAYSRVSDEQEQYTRGVCYLSDLPVDTSTRACGHGGQINDKVADLAVEVVLVGVPVGSPTRVGIRVNDCYALEGRICFEDWKIGGISDELSVVVLDDRSLDEICSRGKEDDRRGDGG